MDRNATRIELINIGTGIISERGFGSTGIGCILKSASVPKGSFYYYFASKEDFGLAIIDKFAGDYRERLDSFLLDDRFAPLDRIRNWLEAGMRAMLNHECKRGCLIGNLSQELSGQNEKFRLRLDIVFQCWKKRLADCLKAAQRTRNIPEDADVEQLAEFLLAGWQGASLRAKVVNSPAPMQTFIDVFFAKVLK